MTLQENSKHPIGQLIEMRQTAAESLASAKTFIASIDEEISRRYAGLAHSEYERVDKSHGKVTFNAPDDVKIESVITKTVKWDSGLLQKIAFDMPWENVQKLFKVQFSMAEPVFQGLVDEEIAKKVGAARTVKYGDPKITVTL